MDELSHMGNGMLVAFGVGKDQMDVRMFFFGPSHESLGDLICKVSFSDAVGSMQKQNMRKCLFS